MITLEKILTEFKELKPESLNDIVAAGHNGGARARNRTRVTQNVDVTNTNTNENTNTSVSAIIITL